MSPRPFQIRELLVRVDRATPVPLGRQLEEQLREAIRHGRLSAHQQLPSTRMLAEDLEVSRGVVVRAYAQLAAEGYLKLGQGANPRVREIPVSAGRRHSLPRNGDLQRFRYDLRPERPDLSRFPRRAWLRSLRQALVSCADSDLGYIDRRGITEVREEIADYLGRARGVAAAPEHVVMTAGSTHALTLIARALARRGQMSLAFENPSNCVLHAMARRAGLEPIGTPVDDDGLVVEKLASSGSQAVVVSPAHQFPLGAALSVERRSQLLSWARERDALIIEDDYDAEFRYDRSPIGALQGLAPERVAYIGSTSKTLAPGLRLAWAVLPSWLIEEVASELWGSMLHLPGIEQLAFADFLRHGEFDRHIRRMRAIYRARRDATIKALNRALPGFRIRGIAAGLHVVVELPATIDDKAVIQQTSKRGVAIEALSQHALDGYDGPPGLLVGFGAILEPSIPGAISELVGTLEAATSHPNTSNGNGLQVLNSNGSRNGSLW